MKFNKSLMVILLFGSMSSGAFAADNYIGGAYGTTDADAGGFDDSDTIKVFGGQRFGSFGYEIGYHDFDRFDLTGSPTGVHITGSAIEVAGMGYLPLSTRVDLFGKAGLAAWDLERNSNAGTIAADDGIDLTYGLGIQFKPVESMSLRLEYQVIQDASGSDLSSTMLGAAYHF